MENPALYFPIATTLFATGFAVVVLRRYWAARDKLHLLWWGIGIALFGVGTLFESITTLAGWEEGVFRGWYISGVLLGGAPLAQGTVYLLLPRATAHRLAIALVVFVTLAAAAVLATPVDRSLAEEHRLSGEVIEWSWVRGLSPIVNTYAFIFLAGGAIVSASRYRRQAASSDRMWGNVLIAIGAILPGIGGTFTRFGVVEVLYVTELVGIVLIAIGYGYSVRERPPVAEARPAGGPAVAGASIGRQR